MTYALYCDPQREPLSRVQTPPEPPRLAYYRLTDLSSDALAQVPFKALPLAENSIAEIHPAQWDILPMTFDRLSIVLDKSKFTSLTDIKAKVAQQPVDITFQWDHRFALNYYTKLVDYWLYCGVTHFSFYGLTDFAVWQRLQHFLNNQNLFFYDRFHACVRGHESAYQKHLAQFGNVLAIGGWSRWTDAEADTTTCTTRTRAPNDPKWTRLSPDEAQLERLMFGMADRDGMPLSLFEPKAATAAIQAGLAAMQPPNLCPTDHGLWDTLRLVDMVYLHSQQI